MALAEKMLAAQFNRDGFPVVDHKSWVFLGDGCLMEGISHEACSLAGTLKLGKLIAFYDDNNISIDGEVGGWFTDDTPKRFEAYGWQVVADVDGHDSASIAAAIDHAVDVHAEQPTPILVTRFVGGSADADSGVVTHQVRSSELGEGLLRKRLDRLGTADVGLDGDRAHPAVS